jgi:hypothetical protein
MQGQVYIPQYLIIVYLAASGCGVSLLSHYVLYWDKKPHAFFSRLQDVWKSCSAHAGWWLYTLLCTWHLCEGPGQAKIDLCFFWWKQLYLTKSPWGCNDNCYNHPQGIVSRECSSRKVPLHIATVAHQLFLSGAVQSSDFL